MSLRVSESKTPLTSDIRFVLSLISLISDQIFDLRSEIELFISFRLPLLKASVQPSESHPPLFRIHKSFAV